MDKKEFEELERAERLVSSAVSRDTGETIPHMMRMCAFVPMNVPILFGMLLSSPTTANIIFWQWFNQSFNAGLNYGNRNASSTYTMKDLIQGYSAAVGSSVSVALLLKKVFSPLKTTGAKQILLNSVIASLAGGTASFLNTFFMRRCEIKEGISMYRDESLNDKLGYSSKECARRAVFETASSRVFLSISCLMTPAVIFYLVERAGRTPKSIVPSLLY